MGITLSELRKMVPDSAKSGSAVDNQYLEPASYDKKAKAAMVGSDEGTDNYDELENQAQNFTAQDTVKKNTRAPLKEYEGATPNSTVGGSDYAVNRLYEEESLDLIDDILDIVEGDAYVHDYCWKEVTGYLKQARDVLVRANIAESAEHMIDEAFKVGSFKLGDGSSVKLTKEDVKALNVAIAGTANKNKLLDEITSSKKDFSDFLTFSKNLSEDFSLAMDNLLSEASDEQLDAIIADGTMSEGEIWNNTRAGTAVGAHTGKHVGAIGGAVVGAAYGGTVGAGVGVVKKVSNIVKRKKAEQRAAHYERQQTDEHKKVNEDVKSLEGSAAPATDTTPELEKKSSALTRYKESKK